MTTLTLVTLAVLLYGALNSKGYVRALALGGATPAGAALVAGGLPVPTFYATALGAAVLLALTAVGRFRRPTHDRDGRVLPRPLPIPGGVLLVLFLLWGTVVTLVAPLLFPGLVVPVVSGGFRPLLPAVVTTSNIAQIGYLLLGVCVIVFVARSPKAGPELVGLALGATVLLSFWRYLGIGFPEGFFDNSPTLAFIQTAPGGAERFRGILSEPSALGGSCLVALAYFLPRSFQLTGARRIGALVTAGIAAYLGIISTSGTFVVAGTVMVLVAGASFAFGFLSRRSSIRVLVVVVACIAALALIDFLPTITDFVQSTIDAKAGSASFDERSTADSAAYSLFYRTFGLGVGLGSVRASSFVPSLLATAGLVGAVLFVAVVVLLVVRGGGGRNRPVAWAVVTLLVTKVIAGPDLSDSTGILWISLGLLSGAALAARRRAERPGVSESSPPARSERPGG
jgi:hypothetical protein